MPSRDKLDHGPPDLRLGWHQLDASKRPVPRSQHQLLQDAVAAHIESFDFMLETALPLAVAAVHPAHCRVNERAVTFSVSNAVFGRPLVSSRDTAAADRAMYPAECRERRLTYKAEMRCTVTIEIEGEAEPWRIERTLGQVPVMVKSNRCHLRGLPPEELVRRHEEMEEMGGYFVINGNEKIIRQLIIPLRNHITALVRPSFTKRGPSYTEFGCSIRCVRPDQSSQSLTMHYLRDGRFVLGFSYRKTQYLIPVILVLRALVDCDDRLVYDAVVHGDHGNSFVTERAKTMLKEFQGRQLYSRRACLAHIGNLFKVVLNVPDDWDDERVGKEVIERIVLVHLDPADLEGKFDTLVVMVRKLLSLVSGECAADNADSAMHQELLVPGHLYTILLKEQLQEYLHGIVKQIETDLRVGKLDVGFGDQVYIKKVLSRAPDIGKKIEYFMATGNVVSPTGLDLMQTSGFTIMADKLNFFRYVSHFRCVHRGAFFTTMKTTAVRKLLPDSWGFLCPVHTPDGSPCGLLNHLTASCKVVTGMPAVMGEQPAALTQLDTSRLPATLARLGMDPHEDGNARDHIVVMLDGKVVGMLRVMLAQAVADKLRDLKCDPAAADVPESLEIGLVMPSTRGQFPGLFMHCQPFRMVRPVHNLRSDRVEYIGPFEQAYLDVAIDPAGFRKGVTTHLELSKTNFLSVVANMTPFSDHNQSPRNMYQCQMAKQTMGFPLHTYTHRSDNKLYCLRTPQTPMVRPRAYDDYNMDTYPLGTNAVVAVISYTGYDMEDAMILSKASKERGFAHAHVVSTKLVDLDDVPVERGVKLTFGASPDDPAVVEGRLDTDGFPPVGTYITRGSPLYSYVNSTTGETRIERHKGEPAHVIQVSRLKSEGAPRATIKLSVNRNPIIGDKFASRHGQKGICSQLWPAQDMPFSESGMIPDILFNPHGFPSRMTIGMLVESMAGKSAALHGVAHDATPFTFSDEHPASAYFGEQLEKAGYNFYGHERMYSGITGEEFEADIFIGVVYYQRLRHMVSDKFQVRTTGPVHNLTHQPIKGRKRAGGVRFGEMERDSLLSHGASFVLQDRLLHCSDRTVVDVCRSCGLLISPIMSPPTADVKATDRDMTCSICGDEGADIVRIEVPYVFRYLVAELLSMNVKVSLDVKPAT